MATTYKEYVESDAVRAAKAALEQQAAQKPGEYKSQWQQSLNDAMNKILNREKFTYDLNGDALYQQYKDQYVNQGKQAMMDTMGQAAALTGGYGNSYAQSVGQQTYQGYLQNLNNKIPELYQLARNNYDADTAELYNRYGLYADREDQDYGRYRDLVSDWNNERDFLSGRYDTERNYDYGKYSDNRDFQWQQDRATVADEQWQKEFDEAIRQFLAANPDAIPYYNSLGGSPSSGVTIPSNIGTSGGGLTTITLKPSGGGSYSSKKSSSKKSSSSSGGKSVSQLAQEVLAGKWGNGADRKKALAAAGYDASAVQAAVNKLVGGSSSDNNDGSNGDYNSSFKMTTGSYRYDTVGTKFNSSQLQKFETSVGMCRTDQGRAAMVEDAVMEGKITGATANSILKKFGISDERFSELRGIK